MSSVSRPWRNLEDWAQDPALIARAAQEFPGLAEALAVPADRRRVLKLMAAALAMGGLSGCDLGSPSGRLVPAVMPPPNIVPGLPNFYSTASVVGGYATGILVKHHMGRPIKVEGNPQHPASLGATDVFAQAQLLSFYDPERGFAISRQGQPSHRQALLTALASGSDADFRILTRTVTSPTLAAQLDAVLSARPGARWHQWESVSRDECRKGALLAYGQAVSCIPRMDQVDVLLAIDSDLLSSAPGHLRFARDFASRRNPTRTEAMSRIYAIEPTPTLTGLSADHRFVAGPAEIQQILRMVAATILEGAAAPPGWIGELAADLRSHAGRAFVHLGPNQPAEAHALVHAINERLGGRGTAFDLFEPVEHEPTDQGASLRELVADMQAGKVQRLLILDSNPVYDAPGFAEALKRVRFSLALTTTPDETSNATTWAVPMMHEWETWSDARAYDGTATVLQPQSLPLYGGMSAFTLLRLFNGDASPAKPMELVQAQWNNHSAQWSEALAQGIVVGTAAPKVNTTLRAVPAPSLTPSVSEETVLTLLFRADPHVWDGRFANNPWLQELPRPLTKLTWDNPLLISPSLARKVGVRNGDHVRVSVGDAGLTVPVWIQPGQSADSVIATLGFGRQHAGDVASAVGVNFNPLIGRTGQVAVHRVAGSSELASTDHHNLIFNAASALIKQGTLSEYQRDPRFLADNKPQVELYGLKPEGPAAWGMSIDLNTCIGCNACVVSCQAENNIPVVGKDQVIHQREMHWLRIDRYWEGNPDTASGHFQPVMCMHCEQAPCETVCPVGATVHDAEGLNVMVYNRCVGTRFCSNNCPYKVRRFNYYGFAQKEQRPAEARNPEVTVRARGVMENCTFCVQRIAEARILADRENRPVGEVRTACQAACPTQAITFGNLADSSSEVVKRKRSPLDYSLLADQNTHPRVTYEARIRNRNPAIVDRAGDFSEGEST
jgi:MoCo/4Fe-4S cofactor protein with predicted Tat translocation signal